MKVSQIKRVTKLVSALCAVVATLLALVFPLSVTAATEYVCKDGTVVDPVFMERNGDPSVFCASHGGLSGSSSSVTNCVDQNSVAGSTEKCNTFDPTVTCQEVNAAAPNYRPDCLEGNPIIENWINPLIKFFSAAVGIAAAAMIIYSGIQYAVSDGDPKKTSDAKAHIINTMIGLVAYLFLLGFLQFIVPGGVF